MPDPPALLNDSNTDSILTLPSLLAHQSALSAKAREIMPFAIDACSYPRGPVRQAVYACRDCEGKGVCYGCAVSCHAGCTLVELFQRRNFTCDCPTSSAPFPSSSASPPIHKRCALYTGKPPQPLPPNEGNAYGPNFTGVFCRCGRPYDPLTEREAMIACLSCEDWFHESCLNLQEAATAQPAASGPVPEATANEHDSMMPSPDQASALIAPPVPDEGDNDSETAPATDEEENESPILSSSAYEHLICGACVRRYPVLKAYAGTEGWMMVLPAGSGAGEEAEERDFAQRWRVVGKGGEIEAGGAGGTSQVDDRDDAASSDQVGTKRKLQDEARENGVKRAKIESEAKQTACTRPLPREEIQALFAAHPDGVPTESNMATGDVFLSEDALARMCRCPDCELQLAALPFPLEEEEAYEPPIDHEPEPDLDAQTAKALDALPRSQALESIMRYNEMKDKLKAFLEPFRADGRVVSADDINDFWVSMRGK